MLKKEILGEKLMKDVKAGASCLDGGGCDCTSSPRYSAFTSSSEGWLEKMEAVPEQ
jgi:hypothetical protein